MTTKPTPKFDTTAFLARIGDGRSIHGYNKGDVIFSQGHPAEAVFFIQRGKVKVSVVSEQGKAAVVALLGKDEFFGEGCLAGQSLRMRRGDTPRQIRVGAQTGAQFCLASV